MTLRFHVLCRVFSHRSSHVLQTKVKNEWWQKEIELIPAGLWSLLSPNAVLTASSFMSARGGDPVCRIMERSFRCAAMVPVTWLVGSGETVWLVGSHKLFQMDFCAKCFFFFFFFYIMWNQTVERQVNSGVILQSSIWLKGYFRRVGH